MAFFNRRKRSKLFVAFLLTLSMIATFSMPISIYAAEDNAREPTLTEGTLVEEGLDLIPAEETVLAPTEGTDPAPAENSEQGAPTDPEQGTPAAPEQGAITDPEQELPPVEEETPPVEEATPPAVEIPAAGEEVVTEPAIVVEEIATEPAIVVEPTAATLTIIQRLIADGEVNDFAETVDGLAVGQSVNLADYVVDAEYVVCISDLLEMTLSEESTTVVLEYNPAETDITESLPN